MLPRPGQLNNGPTDAQIMATWPGGVMPAGWYGGPRTPQGMTPERQYAGHAQYDPELFAEWRQQHPNDPRQYAGPSGLPEDYRNKVYDARGNELRNQQVLHDLGLPNQGGGHVTNTPGHVPRFDDPNINPDPMYWRQRGEKAIGNAGAPFLPGGSQYNPPPTGGGAPTQGTPLDYNALNAALRGHPAGTTMTLNGRTYRINENGAIIDVTGGQRTRVTDRQGQGLPQNLPSVGATSAATTGTPGPGPGTTGPGTTGTASTQSLSGQTGTGGAPGAFTALSAQTGATPGHSFSTDPSGTYHWNNARAEPVPWVNTFGTQNFNPGGAGYVNTKGPNFLGYDSNGVEIGNRGYMGAAPFNRPDLFSGGGR